MKPSIWLAVALAAFLFFLVWGLEDTSAHRAYEAKTWTDDKTQFYATGTFNTTLAVTMSNTDPDGGIKRCDMFLGEVLRDPKTTKGLLDKGFTSLRCGGLEVGIR